MPDTINSAIEKAKKGLVFVRKEITEEGEIIYKGLNEIIKQKDPYMVVPDEDKTYSYVWQHHYRGKSVHVDLRMESVDKDFLIGWTVADGVAGAIKEPVLTMADARKWDKTNAAWKINYKSGQFKIRRTRAGTLVPAQLRAFPKAPEPKAWLEVEGITKPGTVGATKEFPGIFTIVDGTPRYKKAKVEYGAQKLDTHEYFLSGGLIKGRLMFRRLAREALQKQEAVLPPGTPEERAVSDVIWNCIQPIDQTPLVLQKREVDKKWMPPLGKSALPKAVRQQIPEKFHYWKAKSTEAARGLRDDLVQAMKDKEVEIDFEKLMIKAISEEDIAGKLTQPRISRKAKFVLQHRYFLGPKVIRATPSVQFWDFRVDTGKPSLIYFVLSGNPLDGEPVSGTLKPSRNKKTMTLEVLPPPGATTQAELKEASIPFNTTLNPTKATPAFIRILDKGDAVVLIDDPIFKKFELKGKKMKGLYTAKRPDTKTDLWSFQKSALPETKKNL